ncbi:MAG TPA: hypothetical protein VHM64_12340 [Candidatus Binatia bacterium]|nr:hypothetical protein [Candidatus Binatia bacterium]
MPSIGANVWQLKILIATFCAALSVADANTLQKLSFDRLVDEADLIIRGTVDELKNRPASDRSSVRTIIKISVMQQLKGQKVSSVTIEQPGGSLGEVVQGVPGLADFSSGEDVILFLKRSRASTFIVVGGRQGKFTTKSQPGSSGVVEDFAHRTEALDSFLYRLATQVKNSP